jgi:hypothetical protein
VTALVVVETLLLIMLAVLVVGLLRSHAEILRRLEGVAPAGPAAAGGDVLAPGLPPPRDDVPAARDVAGVTPWGDAVQIAAAAGGGRTLLAFLSGGCSVCGEFWAALGAGAAGELPGRARLVVVTRDASHESPTRIRELASPELTVVMSSDAWSAYHVPVAPYFVLVGGDGRVEGEGAARSFDQVRSLLGDAIADADGVAPGRGGRARADRVERELVAAGIAPDDPSLYAPLDPAERT